MVKPTAEDRARIEALAQKIVQKVKMACVELNVEAEVRVEGSVAKDTWLREEPDIDVFVRMDRSLPRSTLGELGLSIARKALEGERQVERFAEHPYLEAYVDGTRVNVVPCYEVARGKWLSATDRTPYHTDYVRARLTEPMRDEVRLLKKFLKGIGVYGAEIKIGGFSGYLCELLILCYGAFSGVLQAFASSNKRLVIDLEKHYDGRMRDLELLFPEPLVVVDPVDAARNVASAVREDKLHMFVAASRAFLEAPDERFFFPAERLAAPLSELERMLAQCGRCMLFVVTKAVKTVPDVLWGQLYRTERAFRRLLERNDFRVFRSGVWTDEDTSIIFVFELEQLVLPRVKLHVGPPVERRCECEDFLKKYAHSNCVIAGPYLHEGRWVVQLQREECDAVKWLRSWLKSGQREFGAAELVKETLKERAEVFANGEILSVCKSSPEFAVFLSEFIACKPFWLRFQQSSE
jgi:tRNA nucleotidyltransferase (CCA-adding enzyme)